jgi:hypothetical protein
VPFLHYDGDSDGRDKLALSDPDAAWASVGAIVCTTSLSIGVDPKTTTFGRVFLWTHPMGCLPLAQIQAALRFMRFPHSAGSFNSEICALLGCIDPRERARREATGALKPRRTKTFQSELKNVANKKARRVQLLAKEEMASGKSRELASAQLSELVLRCMAHNNLEVALRTSDHYGMLMRVCEQHNITTRFATEANAVNFDFAGQPDVDVSEEQAFAALKDEKAKMACARATRNLESYVWIVSPMRA